jgi:methylated-DNA-[protein]-cysteine S-methyltransferase
MNFANVELPFGKIALCFHKGLLTSVQQNEISFVGREHSHHPCIDWFKAYARGQALPVPLESIDISKASPFQIKVLTQLANVAFAHTTNYAELAKKVGSPRAARAVGQALHRNPCPIILPCHRIISSSQKLGGFAWGQDLKVKILIHEGVFISS